MTIERTVIGVLCLVIAQFGSAAELDRGETAQLRRQVEAAFAVLSDMMGPVSEAFATSGKLPSTYSDAKLSGPTKLTYATVELGPEGTLKIVFKDNAHPLLARKEMKAVPMSTEHGDIQWYCLAPSIPKEVRPEGCR